MIEGFGWRCDVWRSQRWGSRCTAFSRACGPGRTLLPCSSLESDTAVLRLEWNPAASFQDGGTDHSQLGSRAGQGWRHKPQSNAAESSGASGQVRSDHASALLLSYVLHHADRDTLPVE